MKICFITTGDIVYLATMKRAVGMAEYLIREGHDVAIIALDCENNRKRIRLEAPNAVPLFFSSGNFMSEIVRKNRLVKSWNPDIVYVCAFVIRNFIYSGKYILIAEHSELNSSIKNSKWYKRYWEWILEYFSLFWFDGQILASRYLEALFQKRTKCFMQKKPLFYSPYAYNKDILLSKKFLIPSLKGRYIEKKVILYIGTLAINYGFLDILKVANVLKEQRDDFVILILGGHGSARKTGEKFIQENNLDKVVHLLNYIPEEELSSYFGITDVFIAPLYDTIQDKARCPSKLFMYLAFQKPVVTCKIGESYSLFGEKGYYYEPENINMFAQVLNEALDTNNLKYIIDIEKHSWEYRTKEFIYWININF